MNRLVSTLLFYGMPTQNEAPLLPQEASFECPGAPRGPRASTGSLGVPLAQQKAPWERPCGP